MTRDDLTATATWGERLAREARRIAASKVPDFRWARALVPLARRITERPGPSPDRFLRRDATAHAATSREVTTANRPEPSEDGEPIGETLRDRLRGLAGLRDEPMHLHRDDEADRLAHAHHADAVTVGAHVFFREGQLQPDEPRGLALLAHEATHVIAAMRPGASWRRATESSLGDEERVARLRERSAIANRGGLAGPPGPAGPPGGLSIARRPPPPIAPAAALPTAPASAARPMAADIDRPSAIERPAGPSLDVEGLRQAFYRGLMDQVRTDRERGG